MRRRLVVSTIAIVLVVLGALTLPVGIIVYDAAERQLDANISDQATTIAAIVSEDVARGQPLSENVIRDVLGPNDGVEIITASGAEIIINANINRRRTCNMILSFQINSFL